MTEFKLKDLLQIKNGRDYKHLAEGEIPVYGSGGLMTYVNKALYKGESILLPRKGTLSNIQYVNEGFWTVDTIYYSIIDKSKAEPYYLYRYLTLLDLSYLNSGTGVPSMTFGAYYDIPVKLPILQTQKQIAKVLTDLDAKIEVNNKINQELEAMAKTLYDYWFVQFDFPIDLCHTERSRSASENGVNNKINNSKGYKSSGGKMVFNEELKRDIPEGWEDRCFGDYGTVSSGYAFKSSSWADSGFPVVKIKDITEDGEIDLSNLAFVAEADTKKARKFKAGPGDLVIAMTGATIGKFAIIPYTDKEIYINQRVGLYDLGANPLEKLPFIYCSLRQEYFREQVFLIASGAAQPNISGEQLDDIQLILPPKDLVEKFNEDYSPIFKKILLNQNENQKLSELRDWLLPMLMNGQVSVGEGYVEGEVELATDRYREVAEDEPKYSK